MGNVAGRIVWLRGRAATCFLLLLVAAMLAACDNGVPAATATPGVTVTTSADGPIDILTVLPDVDTPTPAPLANLPAADQIAIYSLVVGDLLQDEAAKTVYISPFAGEGDRLDTPNENAPIPGSLDDSLSAKDSSHTYHLAQFADSVGPLEDGGKVKDNGVFLTLGDILQGAGSDSVTVRGSLYRGVGEGTGNNYQVQRDPSAGWKLVHISQDWNDTPKGVRVLGLYV